MIHEGIVDLEMCDITLTNKKLTDINLIFQMLPILTSMEEVTTEKPNIVFVFITLYTKRKKY